MADGRCAMKWTRERGERPRMAARGSVADADMRLRGGALALARAVWLLVTAAVVALDIAGIPATYTKFGTVCSHCQPDNGPPTIAQARALRAMGISLHFWASYETAIVVVTMVVYIGMGTLLFIRRSDDRMALFASLTLVTFGGAAVTGSMQALP